MGTCSPTIWGLKDGPVNRFHDDLHLVPADEYEPTTVPALLRHLRLETAAPEDQESGVRDWLATHPLVPTMEYSLRDSGHGQLLG